MDYKEFIDVTVGKPWVNRAQGPSSYDCWGLVVDSFKRVDGITLPEIDGYKVSSVATNEAAEPFIKSGAMTDSDGSDGDIVLMYDRNGVFTHVGRMMFGRVLHAWGHGQDGTGQVKWDKLAVLRKLFKVEFKTYGRHC